MVRPTLHLFAATAAMAFALAATPELRAQEASADEAVVRFTRTLGQVAGAQGVQVKLQRSAKESGWDLSLVDRTAGETVGVASLPEWAGAAYYGYDVTVRGFGNVAVVLFEAAPAPGVEAPPAAESFQVAWAYGVKRGATEPVWQQIAATTNSPLDGGDRLVIRREGKKEHLVRLRSSEDARFCGADLAAYQIFLPDQMAFRSALDLDALEQTATSLEATLPAEPFVSDAYRRFFLWFSATSDRYNPDDSRTVIRPLQLGDGDVTTAWIEGASGLGKAEYATARVNDSLKTRGVRIFPGHGASAAEYAAHATPKKLLFTIADGSRYVVDVPASPYRLTYERGGLVVMFPRPVKTRCMSVVLLEGREGERSDDPREAWKRTSLAISELSPISEIHGLPPDVAALVVVEKLLKEDDRAQARRLVQLTASLGDELVRVLQDVLRTGNEEERVRVIPLLRSLPSEASVPILVEMFVASQPSDPAYKLVKPALSSHGDRAATQLLEVLEKSPPKNERKYIDLTRMIGRLGSPDTLLALVERLGDGSERVRQERVRSVSRGGEELIDDLFAVVRRGLNTPAGDDALLALNSIGRKLYYRGQGTHPSSNVLLAAAMRGTTRRTKLLGIKGLGFFATEGAVAPLVEFATDASDPLIRRQAVESLARYEDRDARIALEAALLDVSPDVRIAAIDGLNGREDRRQALSSVQSYVERETWKPGLEVAYTIMAELGDPKLIARMETEVARSPASERAGIIAEAMERAKRPISSQLAASLMFNPETDLGMKRDLIDLLGIDDTPTGEEVLLELVRMKEPFGDIEPRQATRLKNRALMALGRRDSPAGRAVLLEIVRTGASNDERAVALRALAFSRHEALIPDLEMLRVSAPEGLQDAFDSTIELIDRRSDIQDVREGLDEAFSEPPPSKQKGAESPD